MNEADMLIIADIKEHMTKLEEFIATLLKSKATYEHRLLYIKREIGLLASSKPDVKFMPILLKLGELTDDLNKLKNHRSPTEIKKYSKQTISRKRPFEKSSDITTRQLNNNEQAVSKIDSGIYDTYISDRKVPDPSGFGNRLIFNLPEDADANVNKYINDHANTLSKLNMSFKTEL